MSESKLRRQNCPSFDEDVVNNRGVNLERKGYQDKKQNSVLRNKMLPAEVIKSPRFHCKNGISKKTDILI